MDTNIHNLFEGYISNVSDFQNFRIESSDINYSTLAALFVFIVDIFHCMAWLAELEWTGFLSINTAHFILSLFFMKPTAQTS